MCNDVSYHRNLCFDVYFNRDDLVFSEAKTTEHYSEKMSNVRVEIEYCGG